MREYFKALKEADPNTDLYSVTVTDGIYAGEKALISSTEIVYASEADGFIKKYEKDLSSFLKSGIKNIDGAGVYTEITGHIKQMVVCGCGHVSIPLIKLAKSVVFYIIAIDDRPEFVKNALEAGADEGMAKPFDEALNNIEGDIYTYYVVVTRGHHWDELCLRMICLKPHAYIGAMGSKKRVDIVRKNLKNAGIDKDIITNIHSPIGLKIGAETPEEIAVSIVAEIIEIKNRNKDIVFPPDILSEILGTGHTPPYEGRMILSTIIKRSGSAPREAGTKMLYTADNRTVNTIGGGLTEAKIIEKSRELIKEGSFKPIILHLALKADEASIEGEVCGGELDVLMEEVI